jgi:hypothetical protein
MSVEEGFVTGVLVKGIDTKGVLFHNGAGEIESRVLIPTRATIEVSVEAHQNRAAEQLQTIPVEEGGHSLHRWILM